MQGRHHRRGHGHLGFLFPTSSTWKTRPRTAGVTACSAHSSRSDLSCSNHDSAPCAFVFRGAHSSGASSASAPPAAAAAWHRRLLSGEALPGRSGASNTSERPWSVVTIRHKRSAVRVTQRAQARPRPRALHGDTLSLKATYSVRSERVRPACIWRAVKATSSPTAQGDAHWPARSTVCAPPAARCRSRAPLPPSRAVARLRGTCGAVDPR